MRLYELCHHRATFYVFFHVGIRCAEMRYYTLQVDALIRLQNFMVYVDKKDTFRDMPHCVILNSKVL